MKCLNLYGLLVSLLLTSTAQAEFCNPARDKCWNFHGGGGGGGTSAPAYPSNNSRVNINPSAVPMDKGLGVEALAYKGDFDFSLVKGTGRVGAAISPSNSEESFFGPPGFELDADYLLRRLKKDKYSSQKVTLATAANLYDNRKSGLSKFQVNLGVMGKYNKFTNTAWPGGGVTGVAGPFTFGYAASKDEYLVDYKSYGWDNTYRLQYSTETTSVGVYLSSLVLDYSILKIYVPNTRTYTVTLLTSSLMLQRWIFTLAGRTEDSDRLVFDEASQTLKMQTIKKEMFGGVQFAGTKNLMVGAFYNYYRLKEISLGLTLFF